MPVDRLFPFYEVEHQQSCNEWSVNEGYDGRLYEGGSVGIGMPEEGGTPRVQEGEQLNCQLPT